MIKKFIASFSLVAILAPQFIFAATPQAASVPPSDPIHNILTTTDGPLAVSKPYAVLFSNEGPVFSTKNAKFSYALAGASYEAPSFAGAKIEFQRPGMVEWYVNSERGLQQGFTITQDQNKNAPVDLSFTTRGLTSISLQKDQTGVVFTTTHGSTYAHQNLIAYDAKGAYLPARFALDANNGFSIIVDDTNATYPIVIDPFTEEQTLTTSDANGGGVVAITSDGTRFATGATAFNSNKGAVYIFSRSGTAWTQEQRVTSTDAVADDYFGGAIAFAGTNGDRIVIGATGASSSVGAVYIFSRSGTTWTQEQRVVASDVISGDYFGSKVVMDGDGTRIVAATEFASSTQGVAYVFSRSGTTWTQEQKLTGSDSEATDHFGANLAIDLTGSRIAVGADQKASLVGAAYVFSRSGTTWTQEQKLTASDAIADARFGGKVSITDDGSRLLVGSYGIASNTGAAYVFSRSGTTWTQEQKLTASDGASGDYFGIAVGVSGDGTRAVVGAYGTAGFKGATYVYLRSGTTWTQVEEITASDGAAVNFFGIVAALTQNGNRLFVGTLVNKAYVLTLYHTVTVSASGSGSGNASSTDGNISFTYPGTTSDTDTLIHGSALSITAVAGTGQVPDMDSGCMALGGTLAKVGVEQSTCTINSLTASGTISLAFIIPSTVGVGNSIAISGGGGGGGGSTPPPSTGGTTTPADPTAALQAQISLLLKQVADLQAQIAARTGGSSTLFTKNLKLGDIDPEVKLLQQYLNTHGFIVSSSGPGSSGSETTKFGALTKAALIRFQEAHRADILTPTGLTSGTGLFLSLTRAYVNAHP